MENLLTEAVYAPITELAVGSQATRTEFIKEKLYTFHADIFHMQTAAF